MFLAAAGLVLLSPLVEFLPVEMLPYLAGDFFSSRGQYLRVIQDGVEAERILAIGMLVTGVLVHVGAWLVRRQVRSR